MRNLIISQSIVERPGVLDRYFADIKKNQMISGEEEVQLARRIKMDDE